MSGAKKGAGTRGPPGPPGFCRGGRECGIGFDQLRPERAPTDPPPRRASLMVNRFRLPRDLVSYDDVRWVFAG